MKTAAILVSLGLHLGALYAAPSGDGDSAATEAARSAQSYAESCKCDLEMSADCADIIESR